MAVGGCGCHVALHYCVKAKKTKTKFLRSTGYINSIGNPIKHDLLLVLVLVRQWSFVGCWPHVLQLLKTMFLSTVKRYMGDRVRICFGLLEVQVRY